MPRSPLSTSPRNKRLNRISDLEQQIATTKEATTVFRSTLTTHPAGAEETHANDTKSTTTTNLDIIDWITKIAHQYLQSINNKPFQPTKQQRPSNPLIAQRYLQQNTSYQHHCEKAKQDSPHTALHAALAHQQEHAAQQRQKAYRMAELNVRKPDIANELGVTQQKIDEYLNDAYSLVTPEESLSHSEATIADTLTPRPHKGTKWRNLNASRLKTIDIDTDQTHQTNTTVPTTNNDWKHHLKTPGTLKPSLNTPNTKD